MSVHLGLSWVIRDLEHLKFSDAVNSRLIFSWSSICGSTWSDLIKAVPVPRPLPNLWSCSRSCPSTIQRSATWSACCSLPHNIRAAACRLRASTREVRSPICSCAEAATYVRRECYTCTIRPLWASYQIHKIPGCACAGNAGNVFPATAG